MHSDLWQHVSAVLNMSKHNSRRALIMLSSAVHCLPDAMCLAGKIVGTKQIRKEPRQGDDLDDAFKACHVTMSEQQK